MFWIITALVLATAGAIGGSFLHQSKLQRLERKILLLASQKGRITFVDVVRECDIVPDLARQLLEDMGLKGHLSPQVTKEGAMVYRLVDVPAEDRPLPAAPESAAPPLVPPVAPPISEQMERPPATDNEGPRRENVH